MSLETLLAAAWFVEQQDAQRDLLQTSTLSNARGFQLSECGSSKEHVDSLVDQVSPKHDIPADEETRHRSIEEGYHKRSLEEDCSSSKSTSLPVTLQTEKHNPSPVNNDILSKALDSLDNPSTWVDEKDYNKRVAGTREVHNKLEKNRRAHLKECFEILKRQLPSCTDDKKSSNLSILHSALRHIQSLRRKEREFEHEMERLAREKISAQQKLATLKKELSSQWEHIDFSTLLPDTLEHNEIEVREEQCSVSTSTATEEGFDWLTTQNDDDEDGDIDVLSDSDEASKTNSNTSSLSSFAMPCSPNGVSSVESYTENHKSSCGSIPVSTHITKHQSRTLMAAGHRGRSVASAHQSHADHRSGRMYVPCGGHNRFLQPTK